MADTAPHKVGGGAYATWQAAGAGTNAGVTVTRTGAASRIQYATGIQCSGDLAALVTIESPASTVLWRKRITGVGWQFSENFQVGPIAGAAGSDILVKISASTSNCEANMEGYAGRA